MDDQPNGPEKSPGLGAVPTDNYGAVIDPRTTARDLKLLRRAIRNDWPIPEADRAYILSQVMGVLKTSGDERNILTAAKVFLSADSINAKRETNDLAAEAKAAEQHNHLHIHGAVGDPALEHRMEQLGLTAPSRLEQMLEDRLPDPPTNGYHANGNGHANGHTNGHNGHHHNGG